MNDTVCHTAMDISNKRKLDESLTDLEKAKRPRFQYYVRLESESSVASEEDAESIYSIQGRETDVVRDTSDTDTKSESGSSIGSGYEVEVEFEVASMSENDDDNLLVNCTSSDSNGFSAAEDAIAAVLADSSLEPWTSGDEDSDPADLEEFGRKGFKECAQCKSKDNNPLYRLCEKCFQEKKNFYPPRPRRPRKKRGGAKVGKVNVDKLRSCLSGLSQDSGLGSSQELGIDFEQIQVPPQKDSSQSEDGRSSASTGNNDSQDFTNNLSKIDEADECGTEKEDDSKKTPTTIVQDVVEIQETQTIIEKKGQEDKVVEDLVNKIENDNFIKPTAFSDSKKSCIVCYSKSNDSAFLHGKSGHVCCCYRCAMRTWKLRKRCPLCNRKIHNVVRLYAL